MAEGIYFYSIVVPVFNGSKTILELTGWICDYFLFKGKPFELIFVDDGSSDNSWEIIKKISNGKNNVIGVRFKKNYGQLAATTCGIHYSKGDFVITMDDDLQFHPRELEKLITSLERNPEYYMVFGFPLLKQQNFFRKITSFLSMFLFRFVFVPTHWKVNVFSSFRILRREFINNNPGLNLYYLWEIPAKNIHSIPVNHLKRKSGKSNYTVKKMLNALVPMFLIFGQRLFSFLFLLSVLFTGIDFFSKKNFFSKTILVEIVCIIITGILYLFFKRKLFSKKTIFYQIDESI